MTIAARNRFIKIAAFISLVLAIAAFASLILMLVRQALPQDTPGFRPTSVLEGLRFAPYSPLATILAIGVFPFFSLAGLLYILFSFEKTQTVEITFFAACVFAVSFESLRLLIPLYGLWTYANFFSVTISRLVFFSRIFTLLALLSSAVFASGKTLQQLGPSIFLLAFFSFSLSSAIPVNSGNMSSIFLLASGYRDTIRFFLILLGILSALSYLILGFTRNIPEYSRSAGGVAVLLAGYSLLAVCDTWLFLVAGVLLFFGGSWLYLNPIHRYYLWQ